MDAQLREPVMPFDHKRFEVYRQAIAFVGTAHDIATGMPRARWPLADQLIRAATSISLNIAEGAGEHSRKEKARFYRIAKRSAAECAAILDVLVTIDLLNAANAAEQEKHLDRIASMLALLIQSQSKPVHRATAPRPYDELTACHQAPLHACATRLGRTRHPRSQPRRRRRRSPARRAGS